MNIDLQNPPYIFSIILYVNSALSVMCKFWGRRGDKGGGRSCLPDFENEANRDSQSTFERIFPGLAGLISPILRY
jgi:hypothetical protein